MISFRDAEVTDQQFILQLRNDPLVRGWSKTTEEITQNTHQTWFDSMLTNGREFMWIIEQAVDPSYKEPLAYLRLSICGLRDEIGRVSLAVIQDKRGKGVGAQMLGFLVGYAHALRLKRLQALVHQQNSASMRLFTRYDFVSTGGYDTFVRLEKEL